MRPEHEHEDQLGSLSSRTEQDVATLWAEVLQTSHLPDASDNFFALGGDSIAMVTLEFRIKEEFAVELPAGTVLSTPTVRGLSTLIDAARGSAGV